MYARSRINVTVNGVNQCHLLKEIPCKKGVSFFITSNSKNT